eukprot:4368855-Amphidinium_carterae.1
MERVHLYFLDNVMPCTTSIRGNHTASPDELWATSDISQKKLVTQESTQDLLEAIRGEAATTWHVHHGQRTAWRTFGQGLDSSTEPAKIFAVARAIQGRQRRPQHSVEC